LCLLCR
jgi:hypothetical protein